MEERDRRHVSRRHLPIPRVARWPLDRRLARDAPRLAAGLAIALGLGWGFVPIVIRIYASGGSLAGAAAPWTIAAGSLLANALVAGVAVVALRDRRGGRRR